MFNGITDKSFLILSTLAVFLSACQDHDDPLPRAQYTCLFWTSSVNGTIMRAVLDEHTAGVLSIDTLFDSRDQLISPSSIVADPASGTIYWTDYATQQILKGDWQGQGQPKVLYTVPSGYSGPVELALEASSQMIYWTQPNDNLILRAPAIGNGLVDTLFSAKDGIDGAWGITIQVDQRYLYWVEYRDIELYKAPLRTNQPQLLYGGGSGFLRPYGLAVNNNDIFIVDNPVPGTGLPDRILKGSTSGSPLTLLYSKGVDNAYNLAIDQEHRAIYWLNQLTSGGIWKASLDGTGEPIELIDSIPYGQGLTVVPFVQTLSL